VKVNIIIIGFLQTVYLGYLIDGDDILSGIVLEHTCDECLREEESRDPEDIWCTLLDPVS